MKRPTFGEAGRFERIATGFDGYYISNYDDNAGVRRPDREGQGK
jgi:hypothetical protein